MAKKKKVVVKKTKKPLASETKVKVSKLGKLGSKAAVSSARNPVQLVFGKQNYFWVLIGLAMITAGMLLMLGGFNENPAVWDESGIYGFRRTVLAPFLILAGLGMQIFAIFKD